MLDKRAPGRKLHIPVYVSWTYLARLDRSQWDTIPLFVAVVNDYLLRQELGYQLKHGLLNPFLAPMPGDQRPHAEIRKELDRNIEKLERNVKPASK